MEIMEIEELRTALILKSGHSSRDRHGTHRRHRLQYGRLAGLPAVRLRTPGQSLRGDHSLPVAYVPDAVAWFRTHLQK